MDTKLDWVPVSAAALVTGSMALTLASLLTPTGSSTGDTLRLVREQDGRATHSATPARPGVSGRAGVR